MYKIRVRATANDLKKTYNDTAVWTLIIVGTKLVVNNPNHAPFFNSSLASPLKVGVNQSIQYMFPHINDIDPGDSVTVSVDLGNQVVLFT